MLTSGSTAHPKRLHFGADDQGCVGVTYDSLRSLALDNRGGLRLVLAWMWGPGTN